MASSEKELPIREAVGIFFDVQRLRDAIKDLLTSGFEPEELGLLASEQVVERSLGDLYARTNKSADSPQAPAIAFIRKESVGDTANPLGGALFFVGTSGVMGAVVASAAVFGGALLGAVGGIVGVGVVGAVVATIIHQSDAEHLQQQVDEGHILLFVRMADADREQEAMNILIRHCGVEVKMYEIPVARSVPTAVSQPALKSVAA